MCPEGTIDQGNGLGFFGLYLHGSLGDLFFGKANISGSDYYDVEQRGGFGQVASPAKPVVGQTEFLVLKAQLCVVRKRHLHLVHQPDAWRCGAFVGHRKE